jgi:hypothetical protein
LSNAISSGGGVGHQLIEVFVGKGTRVHFAQTEANTVLVGVNADDAQGLDITILQHFLGMIDAVVADLGDVDQAFEVAFKAGKRAKFGQAGNHTFHQLADAEFFDL